MPFPLLQPGKKNEQSDSSWALSCCSSQGIPLLTRKRLFTVKVLLMINICVSCLRCIWKKKSEQSVPHEATLAHMKVNPVVLGIFHGSSMAEIIFSHLTFSPSSQQKPGVRFLRNETLRYFLNRGRISDTYNSLPWWNPSAIIKKSLSLLTHIISVTTVWLSLDYLRNNRYMSYVAANDTGKAGKSLSHSGLSCTFILHAHIP